MDTNYLDAEISAIDLRESLGMTHNPFPLYKRVANFPPMLAELISKVVEAHVAAKYHPGYTAEEKKEARAIVLECRRMLEVFHEFGFGGVEVTCTPDKIDTLLPNGVLVRIGFSCGKLMIITKLISLEDLERRLMDGGYDATHAWGIHQSSPATDERTARSLEIVRKLIEKRNEKE
jgi:hypothetical protein